ncbi:AmmeMemoRadiSam system radical SAM enzyme [Magnetovirga frankeli]|uniref:AmmeMemoRadiSam system radical SAM enzyme n=1 Tax=Magnetovirga frankeli TaxID=947516 RepID=UPI001293E805|nr:AmmeMemoRadiSam system radical SAM enzyme [gamma proteobacterium SS-5]
MPEPQSATEEFWPTRHWHGLADGRVQCDLCPRHCRLKEGQRGLCFIRINHRGAVALTSYGRASGYAIDPIEKKPLYHFLPGTPVLSFGTAGCNLTCKFCQNWDISKSRETNRLMQQASPETIAQAALRLGCRSVAFTYNDPVIFHEYAMDTAQACRELGIKSVAVTAGYVDAAPRAEFYHWMDAANVDLKGFSDAFYQRLCGGQLQPVLETLEYLARDTQVWLETTTLLIPGENDSERELEAMSQWLVEHLGPDVPMHFSAFHPAWRMTEPAPTPHASLLRARQIARNNGVRHVYLGNVHDPEADSSYCSHCGSLLIGRDWYRLTQWNLDAEGRCRHCANPLPGVLEAQPGSWHEKREKRGQEKRGQV